MNGKRTAVKSEINAYCLLDHERERLRATIAEADRIGVAGLALGLDVYELAAQRILAQHAVDVLGTKAREESVK